MSTLSYKHGKKSTNKKAKKKRPDRSEHIKRGEYYEKKRGPHYANLTLHGILKELENQRHTYEENKARLKQKQEQEKEQERLKRINMRLAKDAGLDKETHDKIMNILQTRILIGDGDEVQAESGYQGVSGNLDPTLQYLREQLKKGRYTELYNPADYDNIMNQVEGNNSDGVPEQLIIAAAVEPKIREELKHVEHVAEAVFNSILSDIHKGSGEYDNDENKPYLAEFGYQASGIMDDDYNSGEYGIPGYQYVHLQGQGLQHQISGPSHNPYITFLKQHKGMGYSREELQAMYRQAAKIY